MLKVARNQSAEKGRKIGFHKLPSILYYYKNTCLLFSSNIVTLISVDSICR